MRVEYVLLAASRKMHGETLLRWMPRCMILFSILYNDGVQHTAENSENSKTIAASGRIQCPQYCRIPRNTNLPLAACTRSIRHTREHPAILPSASPRTIPTRSFVPSAFLPPDILMASRNGFTRGFIGHSSKAIDACTIGACCITRIMDRLLT
jgi:hypothetical protein